MKKLLVVGVTVLFLGLAIAPSINANVSKASVEDELVEITIMVCGFNGGKHTVQLTQEEVEELEVLFDSIKERLYQVETRKEAETILKEAVLELNKYGLLGGLSSKQALSLVLRNYNRISNLGSLPKNLFPNWRNVFCTLSGHGSPRWYYFPSFIYISPMLLFGFAIAILFSYLGLENLANILIEEIFLLNERTPQKLMNLVLFGDYVLDITSIGLNGHVNNTIKGNCVFIGFSGLLYQTSDDTVHFLGSAIAFD